MTRLKPITTGSGSCLSRRTLPCLMISSDCLESKEGRTESEVSVTNYHLSEIINKRGADKMNNGIFTIQSIKELVEPIAQKYKVQAIYLFGSYARGDADESSDLDFLVFGGESFKLTMIFSLAEELRSVLKKNVDVFEISEINRDSEFYNTIMKERMFVA